MLKILVIDDHPERYSFFEETVIGKFASVDTLQSVGNKRDALAKLAEIRYDVVIVDMLLPSTAWDRNPSPTGGVDLFRHLEEDDTLLVPKYVVGITSASDDDHAVSSFFESSTWILIRDSASGGDWQMRLQSLIAHAYEVEKTQEKVGFGVDVCVVTALADPEQKAVLQLPILWDENPQLVDTNTYVRTGFLKTKAGQTLSVVLGCSMRMGSTEAALLSYKLIERFRPRILAMAGICAGMEKKVNYGDPILASPVWDWTSSKWDVSESGEERVLPAPHYLDVDREVIARFRLMQDDRALLDGVRTGWPASPPETALRFHIGPSASGPIVVADGKTFEQIKTDQNRDVIGLEMEAYGVYCAAKFAARPRPVVFSIKSVCDFADPRKNDQMQKYAAYTSARTLYEFLFRYAGELTEHS
jgi:nucleoside phosphorylase